MRASRLIVGALVLLSCSAGRSVAVPRHPAPAVPGRGLAERQVRGAFERPLARAEWSVWKRRAFDELRAEGWIWARVAIDTTGTGRSVLRVDPGPRASVGTLELRCSDPELAVLWGEASGIRVSATIRPRRWTADLKRGLRALGERGYPLATATVVRQNVDASTGRFDLAILIRSGEQLRIADVVVLGAIRTRPEVLARLSGLRPQSLLRESTLTQARLRLESRSRLIDEVESIQLRRRSDATDQVDVIVRVRQPATSGRFSAAVGAIKDDENETRISGSVDLAILDLFGTARAFEGRWSDDGSARRRLDLSYLEPMVFGSGIDLRVELGQRHEDLSYDLVRADLRLDLPTSGGRALSLSIGSDRTTFLGDEGRVRWRQRLGAGVRLARNRGQGPGGYGALRSGVEAARVRDTRRSIDGSEAVDASVTQTLVEVDALWGQALSGVVAFEGHLHWRSTETDVLPLPRSERWSLGGATTVRGYVEEQFLAERIGWGGAQVVLGPVDGGQGFVFIDIGWFQATELDAPREEQWLTGFGAGLRAPTTLGAVDLSLGFADKVGFDAGKLHLVLTRQF